VIMYECLVGYAPFSCEDTAETCLMILDWKNTLEFPKEANLSPEAIDLMSKYASYHWPIQFLTYLTAIFIIRLICDRESRIGFNEIIRHPWFKGIDWKNVRNMTPPWKPELDGPTDCRYFDVLETEDEDWFDRDDDYETGTTLFKDLDYKHLPFVGWTFKRYVNKIKPSVSTLFDPEDETSSSETSESTDQPPSSCASSTQPAGGGASGLASLFTPASSSPTDKKKDKDKDKGKDKEKDKDDEVKKKRFSFSKKDKEKDKEKDK